MNESTEQIMLKAQVDAVNAVYQAMKPAQTMKQSQAREDAIYQTQRLLHVLKNSDRGVVKRYYRNLEPYLKAVWNDVTEDTMSESENRSRRESYDRYTAYMKQHGGSDLPGHRRTHPLGSARI